MTSKLSDVVKRIIGGKNFGSLATLMKDGSPQVTPLWVDRDGEHILVNTAMGRIKQKNTKRDPRVALSIYDQENPYRAIFIRGRVVEQTTSGAWEHINKLSHKYRGSDYPKTQGQVRVILRIKPEHITERL